MSVIYIIMHQSTQRWLGISSFGAVIGLHSSMELEVELSVLTCGYQAEEQ